jgi:hypothetical protein
VEGVEFASEFNYLSSQPTHKPPIDALRHFREAATATGPPVFDEKTRHGENPGRAQSRNDLFSLAAQPTSRKHIRHEWPSDFAERFWAAYPRHVAKRAAMASLERVRRSDEVAFTSLLEAVERYAESVARIEPLYVAHAATWLNNRRWEDEPAHLASRWKPRVERNDGQSASVWISQLDPLWPKLVRRKGGACVTDQRGGWWFPEHLVKEVACAERILEAAREIF